ncbi:UDP-3-O-(3-hydroxymyristoyl)glucosamine N-acyltransferase [Candidatus Tachikawaea gelatinosa]|uniref:UDP-3-O-(3-hydroxymyristoyl)glucosamine N-acyltransferase n=1 Tax=Candidatus Tachikawaea gelatinosa TaxID=1410383 RepID=A0A090AQ11_9ENTR|nr:UDP-3-O-(3-hydroxymyristoyl)glucosamine N-acyltransferase [Candidatus Tachikawaea gelatinosa]BAP58402.1 UDP-3-O-(3-hydroxymyristoyl)glucosamine N-acyltransferase [Candidatus Tachikawaea gelatinosa]
MSSIRIYDLAKKIKAKIYGDRNTLICGISSIRSAKSGHITFFTKNTDKNQLDHCQASAIILDQKYLKFCKKTALVVKNTDLAYVYIANFFKEKCKSVACLSSTANIHATVKIGKNVTIGSNTVIESNSRIFDNVNISPNCFIGKNSVLGKNTFLCANVVIESDTIVGNNCYIQANTVIGSDGFGYVQDNNRWVKIPHLGHVNIGNDVEIGSCTTIDRGTFDNTIIGNNVIIDNQCHIAHNVIIGKHTAIAGGVIIAGSTKIGINCKIAGGVVINGHINICDQAIITGMTMVMRSIKKAGIYSSGIPAQKNKNWRKNTVILMNINDLYKKIKSLIYIQKN